MSTLATNAITDASGGNTATINSYTPTESNMAGRNKIINGGMDVWQRSVGPVTGGSYTTADRWLFPTSGITSQQVANDHDTSIPYALQITADGSGYGILAQRVEDVRTLSNRQATVSFWAKSPSTGTFRFFIEQNFGSGGSATVIILDNATQFNITSADTWQFFTVTVTMPSISGKTIGSSSYVNFGIGANSGITNRVMTYSEVQLEAGSVATPFERRQYGQELALCERYYQKTVGFNTATGNDTLSSGAAIMFKTEMRASPTPSLTAPLQITKVNAADFAQSSASVAIAGSGTRVNTIAINLNFANFTGLPTDSCLPVIITGGAITLSAEL